MSTLTHDPAEDDLLNAAPRDGDGHPVLGGIPLSRRLGKGGMATVYYGVHPRLRFEVAVKVLDANLAENPQVVHRFFHEAQVAIQINSVHLVRVLDVNEEHGIHYLVQEFVNGPTAWRQMKHVVSQGFVGICEQDAIEIVTAAAHGLVQVHRRGIVHRDVKPDNILIPLRYGTDEPECASAKLADLGLARMVAPVSGISGEANLTVGTPGFVAPEQALDAQATEPSADVFGLGATLYALLAGVPPYSGENPMDVLLKTARGEIEPITSHREDLHPRTLEILDTCLRHDAQDRYPDAMSLVKELESIPPCANVPPRRRTELSKRAQRTVQMDSSHLLNHPSIKTPDTSPQFESSLYGVEHTLSGHTGWVRFADFSPDGTRLATVSDDKTARIWIVATGECRQVFAGDTRLHAGTINSVHFSPDGRRAVTASQDYHARVWDVETGEILLALKHSTWVNYAEFSPDGKHIVTCGVDTKTYLWDAESGDQLRTFGGHNSNVNVARFNPDGSCLVTASHDRTACIWSLAEAKLKRRLRGHDRPVTAAAFSPDGRRLATVAEDGSLQLWDARTGSRQRRTEAHAFPINAVNWSGSGALLVTASDDQTARIWNHDGNASRFLLNAHSQPLRWAAFSPVDHRVVTASEDRTACIWAPA